MTQEQYEKAGKIISDLTSCKDTLEDYQEVVEQGENMDIFLQIHGTFREEWGGKIIKNHRTFNLEVDPDEDFFLKFINKRIETLKTQIKQLEKELEEL